MKQVIIMRGPSGAGKSTLILDIEVEYNLPATVCSADHYFYFGKEHTKDNYDFKPNHLGRAHNQCKDNFIQALKCGDQLVIVDNTNIRVKEFKWYIEQALHYDYNVAVHTITGCTAKDCYKANTHGVPLNAIQRMIDRFVETPSEVNDIPIDEVIHDFNELRKFKYGKLNKENNKKRKHLRHIKEALGSRTGDGGASI